MMHDKKKHKFVFSQPSDRDYFGIQDAYPQRPEALERFPIEDIIRGSREQNFVSPYIHLPSKELIEGEKPFEPSLTEEGLNVPFNIGSLLEPDVRRFMEAQPIPGKDISGLLPEDVREFMGRIFDPPSTFVPPQVTEDKLVDKPRRRLTGLENVPELISQGVAEYGEAFRGTLERFYQGLTQTSRGTKLLDFKKIARGMGNIALGTFQGGLKLMPAIAALESLTPLYRDRAGKAAEGLGFTKEAGERIADYIVPFVFGKWVGIGSAAGELTEYTLDKSGILDDMTLADRLLTKELVGTGVFLGVVIKGKKFSKVRKQLKLLEEELIPVKKPVEVKPSKIIKPEVKDVTQLKDKETGRVFVEQRKPAIPPPEKQIEIRAAQRGDKGIEQKEAPPVVKREIKPPKIDNNAPAIQRMIKEGKHPREIAKALNIGVREVLKVEKPGVEKVKEIKVEEIELIPKETKYDLERVQDLKNSLAEGELTLKTGRFNDRKLSKEELESVERSVESTKRKLKEQEELKPTRIISEDTFIKNDKFNKNIKRAEHIAEGYKGLIKEKDVLADKFISASAGGTTKESKLIENRLEAIQKDFDLEVDALKKHLNINYDKAFDLLETYNSKGRLAFRELIEPLIKPKEPTRIISEDAYLKAKENLKKSLGKLTVGIDPSILKDYTTIGAYHFETGIRNFAEWSKKMIEDVGDRVKPYLKELFDEVSVVPTKIDALGLRKADAQEIREIFGFDKINENVKQSRAEIIYRVLKDNLHRDADLLARELLENPKQITSMEHAALVLRAREIKNEIDGLSKQTDVPGFRGSASDIRLEALLDEFNRIVDASTLAGRESARAFGIRQIRVKVDYTLASVISQANKSKGKKLTIDEKRKLEIYVQRLDKAEAELLEVRKQYEIEKTEKDRLLAERVAKVELRKGKRTNLENIYKERKVIKDDLRKLGFRVNDVIGLTTEGYYLVGKLASNYIIEASIRTKGKADLKEVIKEIQKDLPDIEVKDIYRALNTKRPSIQAKAKTEVETNINLINRQARLLDKIRQAEEGIFEKAVTKTTPKEIRILQRQLTQLRSSVLSTVRESDKLAKTQKTIDILQDQLTNHYRNIRKKQPIDTEELADLKKRVKALRKDLRLKDTLLDLEEQLRTGDFKIREEYEAPVYPKDLNEKEAKVRILRRKIKVNIRDLKPKRLRGMVYLTPDVTRTAKATFDLSGTLRQAYLAAARRPVQFTKNFFRSLGATIDPAKYETIQRDIENHPNHYIREASGLAIKDIDGILGTREEFMAGAGVLGKVPVYGQVVKASNRHMVTMLNLTRVGMFDDFLRRYPNATLEELKSWASFVNITTGVGDFGRFPQVASVLSPFVFAPKFSASRIEYPFQLLTKWKNPRVRKEIAKDYAANMGLAITILTMAKLAGAEIGIDPEDSDFGKIKVGNTRVDIFAGVQQPVRAGLRVLLQAAGALGVGGIKPFNPLDIVWRFSSYKLSPLITIPTELIRGKTIVGEERERWETLAMSVVPMVFEDMFDAYFEAGIGRAAWVAPLVVLGMGVSTYEKRLRGRKY